MSLTTEVFNDHFFVFLHCKEYIFLNLYPQSMFPVFLAKIDYNL